MQIRHVQSKGADPAIRTENYDPYLDPGCKTPRGVAIEDEETQDALEALEAQYSSVAKVCSHARERPHVQSLPESHLAPVTFDSYFGPALRESAAEKH